MLSIFYSILIPWKLAIHGIDGNSPLTQMVGLPERPTPQLGWARRSDVGVPTEDRAGCWSSGHRERPPEGGNPAWAGGWRRLGVCLLAWLFPCFLHSTFLICTMGCKFPSDGRDDRGHKEGSSRAMRTEPESSRRHLSASRKNPTICKTWCRFGLNGCKAIAYVAYRLAYV